MESLRDDSTTAIDVSSASAGTCLRHHCTLFVSIVPQTILYDVDDDLSPSKSTVITTVFLAFDEIESGYFSSEIPRKTLSLILCSLSYFIETPSTSRSFRGDTVAESTFPAAVEIVFVSSVPRLRTLSTGKPSAE